MTTSLAPFLIFLAGGILVAITRGVTRSVILLAIPILGALNLYTMGEGIYYQISLLNYELTLVRVDRLSTLFGYLFHLAAFLGVIYSLHVKDTVQDVAGILYAGSALGAVFAGDLLTLFIFWELLALTSVFLILARRTTRSFRAAMRYLIIQVLSGVILLAGVLIHAHQTGSIAFNFIGLDGLASWLIFLAFGIKCGFPFLHNWLTDSYPEATPSGTVFLSAFTTKVAVYSLARAFPGTDLLIYIGAAMTMFPIFFAVIERPGHHCHGHDCRDARLYARGGSLRARLTKLRLRFCSHCSCSALARRRSCPCIDGCLQPWLRRRRSAPFFTRSRSSRRVSSPP